MNAETLNYLATLSDKPEYTELVRRYVATCERYAELEQVIADEGFTTLSTKGTRMIHPVMRELRNLQDDLLKMEKELLLTPRSRGGKEVEDKKSKLEMFVHGESII